MKRFSDITAGFLSFTGGAFATIDCGVLAFTATTGIGTALVGGLGALSAMQTRVGWNAMRHGTDPAPGSTSGAGRIADIAGGVPLAIGGATTLGTSAALGAAAMGNDSLASGIASTTDALDPFEHIGSIAAENLDPALGGAAADAIISTGASITGTASSITSAFSAAALGPAGWAVVAAGTAISALTLRLGLKAIFKGTGKSQAAAPEAPTPA